MSQLQFAEHAGAQNPKYLVIFLHGYGSNGKDLLSLAGQFTDILPDAHFISPNAPQAWEGGFPDAYQWFSLYEGFTYKAIEDMAEDVKVSNYILSQFIDEQLARFSLSRKDLFIIGFSQGGMMSSFQGFISPEKIAGVISFSGKLVLPELVDGETKSKPDICLIHGEADPVVLFENFLKAQEILENSGVNFEAHSIPGLEHSIDMAGIIAAKKFIKKQLHN